MYKILYLIVPCYNEEQALPITANILREKINNLISRGDIAKASRVIFVNDGSKDKTWEIIEELHNEDEIFGGINLTNNVGQYNALLAGLLTMKSKCDWAVTIDADLQDDINTLDEMVDKANNGADVVYGVRSSRKKDSFIKRFAAENYYKFMNALGVNLIYNHCEFRLMSRRVLNELEQFKENDIFPRGLIPLMGFKSENVYYERQERNVGKTKFSAIKLIAIAGNSILSFSSKPLHLVIGIGFLFIFISLGVLTQILMNRLILKNSLSGWAGIMCSLWFIGGSAIVCLGIIGEYIGKIYMQVKGRPRYIVESVILDKGFNDNARQTFRQPLPFPIKVQTAEEKNNEYFNEHNMEILMESIGEAKDGNIVTKKMAELEAKEN